ncbi:MAG: ATP-binding cassette domain-containing protein, partial [Pseudomonadota bacterium]
VNGLNPVSRGAMRVATVDGLVDVVGLDERALCGIRTDRVAMVFQQFALLPWRSVLENVAFGLEIGGVPAAERRRRAMEQLDLVHLAQWADRRVDELSGGMQQRVGLARAFATEAPILLMDEPFSALDPLIRSKLQDELLELQARLNRTIIFVSHDLDEALKLGSRIAIMQGGRIIQLDTPQNIVLNPATDYVAEFVAHMNPLNVLRASEIMRPLEAVSMSPNARTLPASTPVRELIRAQLADPSEIIVTEAESPIGIVKSADILRSLLRQ